MKPMARRRLDPDVALLRRLIKQTTGHVLMESTRASIERFAEEYVRDALSDPVWRELARQETQAAVREAALALLKSTAVARKRRRAHARA
jgi:hypothetical protein